MNKTQKIKKPVLLLFLILFVGLVMPFMAQAQGAGAEGGGGGCHWINPFSMACVRSILANGFYLVLMAGAKLVAMTGWVFDRSIDIAIGDPARALFTDPDGVVIQGWRIIRDVTNLFFIFALLYIGISIILQTFTATAKKLLVGILAAALLVNFSLPITRMVIDFSNVIAMEFLCQMSNGTCLAAGPQGISEVIAGGLSFQTIFGSQESQVQPEQLEADKIFHAAVFGIILLSITGFVLLAGALLFIIRTIVLMILVIFSPLAFLLIALPGSAGSWGSKWWSYLLNQAFFAPVFLFFLYLVIMIIRAPSSPLQNLTGSQNASFINLTTQTGGMIQDNIGLIIQFIILIVLLLLSLYSASALGAFGSSAVMSAGSWIRKGVTGYAGKVPGRLARRHAGGIAERIAGGKGAVAGVLRAIPGVARGTANIAAKNRAKIEEIKKTLSHLNAKELKGIAATSLAQPFKRAAAIQQLAELGDLKPEQGLTSKHIKEGVRTSQVYGLSTKKIEEQNYQYPDTLEERKEVIGKASPEVALKIARDEKLRELYFNENTYDDWHKAIRPKMAKTFYEEGNTTLDNYLTALSKKTATELEGMGNRAMASWISTGGGKNIMPSYRDEKTVREEKTVIIQDTGGATKRTPEEHERLKQIARGGAKMPEQKP